MSQRSSGLFLCETCDLEKPAGRMSRYLGDSKQCKCCRHKELRKNKLTYLRPITICPVISYVKKLESTRRWQKANKEHRENYRQEYRKNNPNCRKGESQLRQRTIGKQKQVFSKFKDSIIEIYRNCPKGFQVDHIVPILNDNICGLHVPWNLQYLPSDENNRKHNNWDGTMENKNWRIK